jgi:hypothetical protein
MTFVSFVVKNDFPVKNGRARFILNRDGTTIHHRCGNHPSGVKYEGQTYGKD